MEGNVSRDLREAERRRRRGDAAGEAECLERVVAGRPRSPRVLNRLGDVRDGLGREAEALEAWRRAAHAFQAEGFLPNAIAMWRKVARRAPLDPEPVLRSAALHAALGHEAEAVHLWDTLAEESLARGDQATALEAVSRRVEVADDPAAQGLLARLHSQGGRSEQAREAWLRQGRLLQAAGRPGEAAGPLLEALGLDPADVGLRVEAAEAQLAAGRAAEAVALLQGRPEGGPLPAGLLSVLGRARLACGEAAGAAEALRAALGLEPGDAAVAESLVRALWSAGDREGALHHLEAHLQLLSACGRAVRSATLFEDLRRRCVQEGDAGTLLRVGELARLTGDLDEVADAYRDLADLHATRGEAELARAASEVIAALRGPAGTGPQTLRLEPAASAPPPGPGRAEGGIAPLARRAADLVTSAEALLLVAGAVFDVSAGGIDLADPAAFAGAFPALRDAGLGYAEVARAGLFLEDPSRAWGFFGHRLEVARRRAPHPALATLERWRRRTPSGAWVVTSLVDGQFQRAGFDPHRMVECRGSLEWAQCARECGSGVFALSVLPTVDPRTLLAEPPLPTCPACGAPARPNVLVLGDWAWAMDRVSDQDERLQSWLGRVCRARHLRLVVVECGETPRLPGVLPYVRRLTEGLDARFLRIGVGAGAEGEVSLPLSPGDGLQLVEETLRAAGA